MGRKSKRPNYEKECSFLGRFFNVHILQGRKFKKIEKKGAEDRKYYHQKVCKFKMDLGRCRLTGIFVDSF